MLCVSGQGLNFHTFTVYFVCTTKCEYKAFKETLTVCAVIPIYPRLATPGSLKLFKELEPAIIDFFLGHLGAAVTSFEHIIDLLSNSTATWSRVCDTL